MHPRLVFAVLSSFAASAFAQSGNDTVAHDLFVASDSSLALTLNVASDSNDIFFSFLGPDTTSWMAFGLGSDHMESAVMFLVYTSSSGQNITLSPRLPAKHVEPEYSPDIQIQLLAGSGNSDGLFTANFKCSNCRGTNSTIGRNVDVTSVSQKMCFASGPAGSINSDNPNAGIKRHSSHGSFTMNMQKATGPGGVAAASSNVTTNIGATELSNNTDHDFSAQFHAVIMIFSFFILMPLGIVIIRVLGFGMWHGINQVFSTVGVLIGAGLGIYISLMYNRSKHFNTAHQIFGVIIIVALLGQFVLGFMHYRISKRTQTTTKLASTHVWLGRVLILAGVINAFFGFPLALSPVYNYWLIGLTVAVSLPLILVFVWKERRTAKKAMEAEYIQSTEPREAGSFAQNSAQPAVINLQRMERGPPAYSYSNQDRPTDFQGQPVEPWQRV